MLGIVFRIPAVYVAAAQRKHQLESFHASLCNAKHSLRHLLLKLLSAYTTPTV